jgi:hypothetical protein
VLDVELVPPMPLVVVWLFFISEPLLSTLDCDLVELMLPGDTVVDLTVVSVDTCANAAPPIIAMANAPMIHVFDIVHSLADVDSGDRGTNGASLTGARVETGGRERLLLSRVHPVTLHTSLRPTMSPVSVSDRCCFTRCRF